MAETKEKYPVLPLRDIVVYPKMVVPLFVGRDKSIKALQAGVDKDKNVVLLTQKDAKIDDPSEDDLFKVGTVGAVWRVVKLPDGTVKGLVEGWGRVKIDDFRRDPGFIEVRATRWPEVERPENLEPEALGRAVL